MITKIGVTAAMLVVLTAWVPGATAQETDANPDILENLRGLDPDARREAMEAMSEEQRAAVRKSARSRQNRQRTDRESMTPEQRDAARQERRERFESMSPEQQEAMKERRAGRRQSGDRSSRQGQGQSRRGQNRRGNRPIENEQA